jgi:hypothetical protein
MSKKPKPKPALDALALTQPERDKLIAFFQILLEWEEAAKRESDRDHRQPPPRQPR